MYREFTVRSLIIDQIKKWRKIKQFRDNCEYYYIYIIIITIIILLLYYNLYLPVHKIRDENDSMVITHFYVLYV